MDKVLLAVPKKTTVAVSVIVTVSVVSVAV